MGKPGKAVDIRTFFAFPALSDAVRRSFLASPQSRKAVRRRLAGYFTTKQTSRAVEELPWLLEKTAAWEQLYDFMCNMDNFHLLWKYNPSEVKMYWQKIETKTKKKRNVAYEQTESQLRRLPKQTLLELAAFFLDTGYPAEAERLLLRLSKLRAERKNRDIRQHAFGLLGNLYYQTGKYSDAKTCYLKKIAICKKDGDRLELSRTLGNLGLLEKTAGNCRKALDCYEQAGRECRKLGFVHGIQAQMGACGNVYMKLKEFDQAARLFEDQERFSRESDYITGRVAAMGNKGYLMLEQKKYEKALRLFCAQEKLCGKISDMNLLQGICGNRAVALYYLNRKRRNISNGNWRSANVSGISTDNRMRWSGWLSINSKKAKRIRRCNYALNVWNCAASTRLGFLTSTPWKICRCTESVRTRRGSISSLAESKDAEMKQLTITI